MGLLLLTWLSRHLLNFYMYEVATAMRKTLTGLLYAKALRLSVTSLSEITPGKLINICSGDMALIESSIGHLPHVLAGPLCFLFIAGILGRLLGLSALYALLLAIALVLIQLPLNALILNLRLRIASASDTRISLLQTLVLGIQTVKSYAWERPLASRVGAARALEMARYRQYFFVSGFFQGFMLYSEPLLSLPLLVAPVLSGVPVAPSTLLIGISLMSCLSFYSVTYSNNGINAAINYISVIRRVEAVLLLPEQESYRLPPPDDNLSLQTSHLGVSWKKPEESPQ